MARSAAARLGALVLAMSGACTSGGPPSQALPDVCGLPSRSPQFLVEGERFGGWRLIVLEGRNGVPFELVFDAPQLGSSGCGTPAPEAVLGRFAGGGRWQGEDLVYVYGSVLPPVETVTVSYQNGLTVELRPVAADGMQHRFYAHVSGGTGAVNVSAFDGAGRLIA